MTGIAGIIGSGSREENEAKLHRMTDCMLHESFYNSGNLIDEQLKIFVSWITHRGTFSDCMPVWNETKDICLIFSGETFADPLEIDRLRTHGHIFDSGNAGYLVHLYEELGEKFFERLNGWFSGVVADFRRKIIVLFNDRYALGRIYYHFHEDKLYFASEAKSLLKVLPHLRQIDFKSVGETFNFGCALQNRTLFSDVSLLPGGSMWTFSGQHGFNKDRYFKFEYWENQPALNDKIFTKN